MSTQPYFKFEILHQSKKSKARLGRITTPHGIIETPNFVPVGTNASLKAVDTVIANELGIQLMFCNTYHLMLHPGTDTVQHAGGLHPFMKRQGALITDSGGFQVFSLAYGSVKDELKSKGSKKINNSVLSITEEGVTFRSYRDGSLLKLTPESSVLAQKALGADIIIPLDELPPYHIDQRLLKKSLDRTHRWEERSLNEHLKNPQQQAMYAVIHGGISKDMRKESAQFLRSLNFDGFSIGGSLGKTKDEMIEMLGSLMPEIPVDKPNHLLGIGDLSSLFEATQLGIDTFDSSHPTKCARHGLLFTTKGTIKIIQTRWKQVFEPIDSTCECYTCKHFTLGYLHHLFKSHEPTAHTLASIHNLAYMMWYMNDLRTKIARDEL